MAVVDQEAISCVCAPARSVREFLTISVSPLAVDACSCFHGYHTVRNGVVDVQVLEETWARLESERRPLTLAASAQAAPSERLLAVVGAFDMPVSRYDRETGRFVRYGSGSGSSLYCARSSLTRYSRHQARRQAQHPRHGGRARRVATAAAPQHQAARGAQSALPCNATIGRTATALDRYKTAWR